MASQAIRVTALSMILLGAAGCGLAETAATGAATAEAEVAAAKQAKAQEQQILQKLTESQDAEKSQRDAIEAATN